MKNQLIAILMLVATSITNAANQWALAEITNETRPAGYIYHISAIGERTIDNKISKVVSGLRFICSLHGGEPIIAIMAGNSKFIDNSIVVDIMVDNSTTIPLNWLVDGNIVFRQLSETIPLIDTIKTGKIIKLRWQSSDKTRFTTAFDISGLNFTEFNSKCRSQT